MALSELPIINLEQAENPASQEAFDAHFRTIARDIGFFYLVGHGVDSQKMQALIAAADDFFALPDAEKKKISMEYSPHFRGYTGLEEETTRMRPDYREQIDIGAELPTDPLVSSSEMWRNMQGPNQWPETLPSFKPTVLEWVEAMRQLSYRVLRIFLRSLYQSEDKLTQLLDGPPSHLLKLIHYPGNPDNPQGVGAHKDSGLLTLLLQDQVGGLQVETDTGWIDAPYVENAFVVNIGETLELLTNGYLRANMHRVVTPPKGVDRYSYPFFLAPRLDLGQLSLLELPKELAALAKGPTSDPLNPLFQHVGQNAIKGRLRSHLAVTKRFYPDHYAQYVGSSSTNQSSAY